MGIFDQIKDVIWGTEPPAGSAPKPTTKPVMADASSQKTPSGSATGSASSGVGKSPATSSASANPGASAGQVDVASMLDMAVERNGQKLEWRTSIVDMMKALDLDSSLATRKELARELNYDGETDGSAKMNMWLHKALMKKLAENGGRVPPRSNGLTNADITSSGA